MEHLNRDDRRREPRPRLAPPGGGRFLELGYCFPERELEDRLAELRKLA